MEKDIIADLVSLDEGSVPESPCTPDEDVTMATCAAQALECQPQCAPIPFPGTSCALPVPGIPAHLPQPTAPPLDEVVSGLFSGENGELSSELAAALASCAQTKLDNDKLVPEADPLEMYQCSCVPDSIMEEAGEGEEQQANDFLEMASFLGESEDTKATLGSLGVEGGGSDGGMILDLGVHDPVGCVQQQGDGTNPVDESGIVGNPEGGSVAMGIPYYLACHWQMQQQQQHAAFMLWWQAYLSSCSGMFGQAAGIPSFPGNSAGWALPPTGMQVPDGLFPPAPGAEALFPQLMNAGMATAMGSKAPVTAGPNGPTKRRRRPDATSGGGDGQGDGQTNLNTSNRKGRKPRQEERVCKNCGTHSTPFWRKDKHDGLPLCNACGLYLSKNDAPRPKVLWKSAESSSTMVAESNTTCLQ